ncbi:MAG: POTRA domain-containing protein, partial [Candidatus Neomarinimicrobiota bacterium]
MKLLIYLIVFFNFLFSQGFDDDIKLIEVKVKGNILTSKNTIIFTSGLHKGKNVKTSEFPRAVKKLWELGLFQNIQILYEEETKEGISIVILVEENFILGNIEYTGNKKIKDKKFEEEILLTKGQRIELNTIKNISNQIKSLYKEKGYLNVEVKSSILIPSQEIQDSNLKS